jgi:prolyl-tRNA synthetase
MGLRVLNADGKEVTPIMGSYGIGIERILCAAIELYHDKDSMMLPAAIAPFQVVITPANNSDAAQAEAASGIYRQCQALDIDALLDDRDERPGVKFKDADLIGVPWRIVVGKKLAAGMVELVERKTRQAVDIAVGEAATVVKQRLGL